MKICHQISECQDVNNAWLNFKTCFLHVADNHAPQIEKKVRGRNTPWLSNKIKKVQLSQLWNLKLVFWNFIDQKFFSYLLNFCISLAFKCILIAVF